LLSILASFPMLFVLCFPARLSRTVELCVPFPGPACSWLVYYRPCDYSFLESFDCSHSLDCKRPPQKFVALLHILPILLLPIVPRRFRLLFLWSLLLSSCRSPKLFILWSFPPMFPAMALASLFFKYGNHFTFVLF
jgi:hypothetical protein